MKQISFDKNQITLNGCLISAPYDISKAWLIEQLGYLVLLMDPNANLISHRFNNIIAYNINNQSNIFWKAELPTDSGPDCYTNIDVTESNISAFSYSCYRCIIDVSNGRIISKTFTK